MPDLLTLSSHKLDLTKALLPVLPAALNLQPEWSGRSCCAWASPGCRESCLRFCGRNRFTSAGIARDRKTAQFFEDRPAFLEQLHRELLNLERRARKAGLQASVRLNNLSDLPWETIDPSIFSAHPSIAFHDYTKGIARYSEWSAMAEGLPSAWPENYHLTLSRSEVNWQQARLLASTTGPVSIAVVFADKVPATYWRLPVINGDLHDYRPGDPARCIVGLTAKGPAKHDSSGFVVRLGPGGIQE